jgi:uncharacterized membrane protein YfhO
VRVVERAPERWAFQTDAPGERLLIVPQAYFPGWEARVDGTVAPIVRADYFFQGVYVPAGTHRVELTYRPTSVTIGLLVSLAALVVALAALVPSRLRRRAGTSA